MTCTDIVVGAEGVHRSAVFRAKLSDFKRPVHACVPCVAVFLVRVVICARDSAAGPRCSRSFLPDAMRGAFDTVYAFVRAVF